MAGERNGAGEPAPVICAAISRVPARIRRDGPPPGRGSAHDKHHACVSGRVSPLTRPRAAGRPRRSRGLGISRERPEAAALGSVRLRAAGAAALGSAPSGRPWVQARAAGRRVPPRAPMSARRTFAGRPRAPAGPSRAVREHPPDRRGVIAVQSRRDRRAAVGRPPGRRGAVAHRPPYSRPAATGSEAGSPRRRYLSGRTTPRIFIEPAPARVTLRPGRGAWTIAPSPTYIPTWLASAW